MPTGLEWSSASGFGNTDDGVYDRNAPPDSALRRPDGSYMQVLEDGKSFLRWTQRPNGSWRRPERNLISHEESLWLQNCVTSDLEEPKEVVFREVLPVGLLPASVTASASSHVCQPAQEPLRRKMAHGPQIEGDIPASAAAADATVRTTRSKTASKSGSESVVLSSRVEARAARAAATAEKTADTSLRKQASATKPSTSSAVEAKSVKKMLQGSPFVATAAVGSDQAAGAYPRKRHVKKDSIACAAEAETGVGSVSTLLADRVSCLSQLKDPPEEAERQVDGSFLVTLDDHSTLRWTQRPNGTWRKPEHKRAGWTSELSPEKAPVCSGAPASLHPTDRSGDRTIQQFVAADAVEDTATIAQTSVENDVSLVQDTVQATSYYPTPPHRTVRIGTTSSANPELAKKISRFLSMRNPPDEAEEQVDGSYIMTLEDQSALRWTRRPDGTWRKAEHKRAGWAKDWDTSAALAHARSSTGDSSQSQAHSGADGHATSGDLAAADVHAGAGGSFDAEAEAVKKLQEEAEAEAMKKLQEAEAQVRAESLAASRAILEKVKQLSALPDPPQEAEAQADGSYLLVLEDESSLRWTKRPNGSWRKPEHKRAGWIGELEQEKYVAPHVRERSALLLSLEDGLSHDTRAALDDFEYEPRSRHRQPQHLFDPDNPPRKVNVIDQFKLLTIAARGWQ